MKRHSIPSMVGFALVALLILVLGLASLACGSGGGNATAQGGATAPQISSFTATPASVASGGAVTLAWQVSGATSLSIDQGVGAVTGSSTQVNPTANTTYTLTATNEAGSRTAQTSVSIAATPGLPVIASFTASPAAITSGQSSTLSWAVSGADSLSINQGIGTVTGTSRNVGPSATTTYTLTATNGAGSQTASATVTVTAPTSAIIIDHTCTSLSAVPTSAINTAKSTLKIAYSHTSHGSQLITGMDALMASNSLYSWNEDGSSGAMKLDDYAMGGDVGYYPDWVNNTRSYLGTPDSNTGRGTSHSDVNVIIWSWCGQAASQTEQTMITNYLSPMNQLELDYPGIKFVYMTGHLDGTGSAGNLNLRNEQIRAYCRANNKILFDFADIESYAPGGSTNYMALYGTDGCEYDTNGDANPWSDGNWATEWLAAHPSDPLATLATSCGECAHSQRLNCIMKARAAWCLWARLAGWDGN